MERKIILTAHGNFAAGIQTSLTLVCGETRNAKCPCAYMEQPYDLAKTVKDILKSSQQNELIMTTDLFGGSVNNEFFNYMGKQAMHSILELNLVTLIEIYAQINTVDSLVDLVRRAVEDGQESLCYCSELSDKEILEGEFWEEMK